MSILQQGIKDITRLYKAKPLEARSASVRVAGEVKNSPPREDAISDAAYTTDGDEYLVISHVHAGVSARNPTGVQVRLKVSGVVFLPFIAGNSAPVSMVLDPPIVVPPNTEVTMTAAPDTAGSLTVAGFSGYSLRG